MKRYVVSPVIGAGTVQNPFRAAADDVSLTNINSIIPTHVSGPQAGQPKYSFALSVVGTANLPGVLAVSNSLVFPDYPLDGRMDGMEPTARDGWQQSLEAFVLDANNLHFDGSHTDDESWRQVLDRVGKQLEPAFNVNNFDAQEPQQ